MENVLDPTWKEKILDYEIETRTRHRRMLRSTRCLKREDTRLRDWNDNKEDMTEAQWDSVLKREDTRLRDWNMLAGSTAKGVSVSWKEKILDYEIETHRSDDRETNPNVHLKREDTRLRDWNFAVVAGSRTENLSLKREDTRLRDWNLYQSGTPSTMRRWLEKRRYSITRLKQRLDSRCR